LALFRVGIDDGWIAVEIDMALGRVVGDGR
jgi:hypothetical protein